MPADDDVIPPISPRTRRLGAREALIAVGVCVLLLVLALGPSVRRSGERMDPGPVRDVVLAVGKPVGWLGDRLPVADLAGDATAWLSPDDELSGDDGFATVAAPSAGGVAPVTPDAFAPADLGATAKPAAELGSVLVTGDSMAMPLDAVLARRWADGPTVVRQPRVGTGISKSDLLDWGALARRQAAKDAADAVVVFLGANEGFPIGGADCCGADWAAAYATRARTMMDAWRRKGAARVYWLTLPMPRDEARQEIARTVNAAIRAAAAPYRAQVRVLDMAALFTPGGRYRDDMDVEGRRRLVRQADGIHLNEAGAELAADEVQRVVAEDFR